MLTKREVVWRRTMDGGSLELAQLLLDPEAPEVIATVLAVEEALPLRVDYHLVCGASWQTRLLALGQNHGGAHRRLRLERDRHDCWRIDDAEAPSLARCTDVDLGISPATNALPINRLGLAPGESAEIRAAWVRFPSLEVQAARQSYERLDDRTYRYRGLDSGFTAVITVDGDGFPVDYEGIWRRVGEWPPAGAVAPVR